MSEIIQSEALINLLDRKEIIAKEALMDQIKKATGIIPRSQSQKN